jgi:hypothetical protein
MPTVWPVNCSICACEAALDIDVAGAPVAAWLATWERLGFAASCAFLPGSAIDIADGCVLAGGGEAAVEG